MKPLQ